MEQYLKKHSQLAYVLVPFALALGLVLRLLYIGQQSLWFDEAASILIARQEVPFILSNAVGATVHPPLYYLLLHTWIWFGQDEAVIRLLSALLNVLTMPVLYAVGSRMLGRSVGVIAVFLFAITPSQIQYSQEATMYALLVFLTTLAMWCFLWASGDGRWYAWLGLALTMLASLYTHYLSIFTLIALHLFALTRADRRQLIVRLLALDVFVGLLFVPQAWIALGQLREVAERFWLESPTLVMLLSTPSLLFTNATVPVATIPVPVVLAALVLSWAIIPLLTIQLFIAWRSGSQREKAALTLLVSLALCAPVLSYLISQVNPVYLIRTLLTTLPACTLLLAWLLVRSRYRWIVPLCIGSMVGIFVISLGFYYLDPYYSKEPLREVISYLHEQREEGDIYVHTSGHMYLPFLAYGETTGDYLLENPERPAAVEAYGAFGGQVVDVEYIRAQRSRVWLVTRLSVEPDYVATVKDELGQGHVLVGQTNIQRVWLYLYVPANEPE